VGRAKFYLLPAVGLAVLVSVPSALATASTNNDAISNLFNIILIPAILIGGLVYVLVFASIILFRRKPGRRRTVVGRFTTEHRALEVAWTLIPAFVLILVGVLSIQVLSQIEYVPAGAKDINVIGHQWYWEFQDPATGNTTTNLLTVQVGQIIHVHAHSGDVIHSFAIPDMGIKIDSFPDRITHQWFQPTIPGIYLINCTEFCGLGHYGMKAKLVVVPKPSSHTSNPSTHGNANLGSPGPSSPTQGAYASLHAEHLGHILQISQSIQPVNVQLHDGQTGCPSGNFCILPAILNVNDSGSEVHFVITNTGTTGHNFTVGDPFNKRIQQIINPGQTVSLFVNITQSTPTFVWCDVPGHRSAGMESELRVDGKIPIKGPPVPELPLAQWVMLGAISVAVASAAIYHVRAIRRVR
jgi:heme/copper-type cytochrome/quinol oxidase subunit 2